MLLGTCATKHISYKKKTALVNFWARFHDVALTAVKFSKCILHMQTITFKGTDRGCHVGIADDPAKSACALDRGHNESDESKGESREKQGHHGEIRS